MSIKSKYYQTNEKEFTDYLNNLKTNESTLHFFKNSAHECFYYHDGNLSQKINQLHQINWQLDGLLDSFSDFSRQQLMISFLIDEVQATNKIENIHSTRHDIFYCINDIRTKNNKKLYSIVNGYQLLLKTNGMTLKNHKDIRQLYDTILLDGIQKEDYPDGLYYRQKPVFISDGTKSIHAGFSDEEAICMGMQEVLDLFNSNIDLFEKIIISHYLIETIHPYYDGNGRLGRFLFTNQFYLETKSMMAFTLSNCLVKNKNQYYKAFKEVSDYHEFGCINVFVSEIIDILIKELTIIIQDLKEKKGLLNKPHSYSFTKSQDKIYALLKEGTLFSFLGLKNEEIITYTHVSKRTLMYALNRFKKLDLLEETKVGKYSYWKLKTLE